ncbi:HAD-IIIC family phosphatase, partial [Campylobacter sp. 2018MI13]|uniref:HAD-IIIC family phosphatase n=1 Tax=Campylobacter sp. 2018MI13 TaxID=2836737 RepID=UPI001BD9ED8F
KYNFIQERIDYFKTLYKKNILFCYDLEYNLNINNSSIIEYNLNNIKTNVQYDFYNTRLEKFTGTFLSSNAINDIAFDLGLNYIPSIVLPTLKALAIDLDNTLYSGVLGEDGINGINITQEHKKLQQYVIDKFKEGFFVCIVSKNDIKDVEELIRTNDNFILKNEYITKIFASWDSKSNSIIQMAQFLNINTDSILFIDDNLGELTQVRTIIPNINIIHAKDDAGKTLNVLKNYPRMKKFNLNFEDSIRSKDSQSNNKRTELQNTLSYTDYLKSLNMHLTYDYENIEQINRIFELANKTNQFILSYKRYSLEEVKNIFNDSDYKICTINLKDNLSDSGIIGVIVGKKTNDYLIIEEAFVSCRALGRGIDDFIVTKPILLMMEHFNVSKLKIFFTKGDRNLPAEMFINEHFKNNINQTNDFKADLDNEYLSITIKGI